MGELVHRGSKYTNEDRRRAVSEYARTGTLSAVSATTGIPRRTLAGWFKSDWWDELLRHDGGEPTPAVGEDGEVAKKKNGRPTAFKPEYGEQARQLCLLGATDQDLADFR